MLEIDVLDAAQRFIAKVPAKHGGQIALRIQFLASNPTAPRSKLLEGFAPLRRFRSGGYRIIYFVDGNYLRVVLVDRRNDDAVYRRLKRMFQ